MRRRGFGGMKFLTASEKKELFQVISADKGYQGNRNKAIFYLSEYCALRASEVALITISDFNPYKKSILCRRLKGSRSNTLKIVNPEVLEALESYYQERLLLNTDDKHLFLSRQGQPISRKTLDRMMKIYCAQTHIPDDKHHFHALKHTRAMELIEYDDIKVTDVQWYLGHRNIQNTMIYLDYTSNAMNSLFNKLGAIEGL